MVIKIATRKSKLALMQTNLVINQIVKFFPKAICEIIPVLTTGDKIVDKNLYDIGGKALFLKELEEKLLNYEVDLAVHSLKDVPGILSQNLEISAVLEREDPRDCFVSYKYKSIQELPNGAIIGSSSIRRKVVLHKMRPDLKIVGIRGNVQTRVEKLKNESIDGIILACAGLKRINLFNEKYCFPIEVDEMIPSAGQGIIALQSRTGDDKMLNICAKINHLPTWYLSLAEREFLVYFDASCRTPISAYAHYVDEQTISTSYMYGDFDGSFLSFYTQIGNKNQVKELAIDAARKIEFARGRSSAG